MCVYASVNVGNGRGREMRKFWNDVNECLRSFEKGSRIVLMGDMNGRVGRNEVAGVAGKRSVDGVNEKGEHLVDVCAERGLFLANTFFQHRLIHRYTWRRRDERGEQKSMINYIVVDERIKRVVDARVMRDMFDGSDHYVVAAKIQTRDRWEYGKKCKSKGRQVIASERLERKEVREEYKKKVCEKLRDARMTVREETSVNDMFNVFKEVVMTVAQEVVGYRVCKDRMRGSAWWTDEIKGTVEEKKRHTRKCYR